MKLRNMVILALALVMVVSVSACGGSASNQPNSTAGSQATAAAAATATEATATEAAKDVVTLKLVMVNNMGGINNTDSVTQALEKKLNIKIEYSDNNEDKFKVMLASSDIGDIVSSSAAYEEQMVNGGQLIPLDDLLNSNGKDLIANNKTLLDYSKQYLSFGQNKVFLIPVHGVPNLQDAANAPQYEDGLGPYIRWDYYQELGSPEVSSPDEYLNLLADMQKKHTTTTDGKKTYPLALHTDWNGWSILRGWPALNYGFWNLSSNMSYYNNNGEFNSVLDDSNPFWTNMDFYYKAQKMGLLDPDSFTQKNANVEDKIKNGQVFCNNNDWDNSEINAALAKTFGTDAGMAQLIGVFPHYFKGTVSPVGYGTDFATGITKNCKNPDRAMELLNYLSTYEGARLVYSGIKGVNWDVVDGKPAMKDETINMKLTDPDFMKKTGINNPNLGNMTFLDSVVVDPTDGGTMDLSRMPNALAAQNNAFQKKYCAELGVSYPQEAVGNAAKAGKIIEDVINTLPQALMAPLSDDNKRIASQAQDYLIKSFAKAVLSKSDADYTTTVKAMKEDLKKMGVDKLVEQEKADFQKAWTAASSFTK
jgi:putative aldouronate transport system substrate-binding protein